MLSFVFSARSSQELSLASQGLSLGVRRRFYLIDTFAFVSFTVIATCIALTPRVSLGDDAVPSRVQEMCDFLAEQPSFGCEYISATEISSAAMNHRQEMKFQFRLQRPSRLALVGEEGPMGMTVVSDGKQLTQYIPAFERYVQDDAPENLDDLFNGDAVMVLMMLGPAGGFIPTGGDGYCDRMMSGVTDVDEAGDEMVDSIPCERFDFKQEAFDWSLWIRKGEQPVPVKMSVDISEQAAEMGALPEGATLLSTVEMKDWNLSPQWTEEDFRFVPPAGAKLAESLMEGIGAGGAQAVHPLIGEPAPLFETSDRNEEKVTLEAVMKDQVVVLDFWATWCGPCVDALPKVAAVTEKYEAKGVRFFAVNVGEGPESVEAFLKEQSLDIPVLFDEDSEISVAYSASAIPQTVIIGKTGIVEVVHVGSSPQLEKKLKEELDQLLEGKSLAQETLAKAEEEKRQREENVNAFGTEEVWRMEGRFSGVAVHPSTQTIFAGQPGGGVRIFDADGKEVGEFNGPRAASIRLANLIGDEQPEVLSFQSWGQSVIAQTSTGETLWKYELGEGVDDVWAFDINADGHDEVIVGYNGSAGLHVLDNAGELLWKNTRLGNVWHVTAGDVDQDGDVEVLTTSAEGKVHVFSASGEDIANLDVAVYASMVRTLLPTDSKRKPQILVSGSSNQQSELMLSVDLQGNENFSLELPTLDVNHVDDMAIAHDARLAAVAMRGGLIHVIELDEGELIATIAPQGSRCSVSWLPREGKLPHVVVTSETGTVAFELER